VGVSEFVIGYDHHFGHDRKGTIETVERLGKMLDFDTYVVSRQEVGHETVSSTAIREAIGHEGDMEKATEMLQRRYRLSGTVVHGDKRGEKIGFPTANIKPEEPRKIIPKEGVYAVKARINEEEWNGMMNIGTRPTFDGKERTLEVHLFEFDEKIYGKVVEIIFFKRIRDEIKFNGVEELTTQLKKDESKARKVLND